jgi:hypothetical protein
VYVTPAMLNGLGADLSKFAPSDIDLVMKKMGVARWELERSWTDPLLTAKIAELKAGETGRPVLTETQKVEQREAVWKPLETPESVAWKTFKEGVAKDLSKATSAVASVGIGMGRVLKFVIIGGSIILLLLIAGKVRGAWKAT